MPFSCLPILRTLTLAATLSGALLATGCAHVRSYNDYSPPAPNSSTDAAYQAQGGVSRNMLTQAPSQIEIPLNNPQPAKPQAGNAAAVASSAAAGQAAGGSVPEAGGPVEPSPVVPGDGSNARMKHPTPIGPTPRDHAAQRAFLPQAETFVGTFPCESPSTQCMAQRLTLTLGPNGRWRSRATYLASQGQPDAPKAEQGCWNVTGDHPAHLLLLDTHGNPTAELVASAYNILSIKNFQGRTPTLPYTLARQPDLDPIDELSRQPLPNCE